VAAAPTYCPWLARESTAMMTPCLKMKPSVVVPCSILIALGASSAANASRRKALGCEARAARALAANRGSRGAINFAALPLPGSGRWSATPGPRGRRGRLYIRSRRHHHRARRAVDTRIAEQPPRHRPRHAAARDGRGRRRGAIQKAQVHPGLEQTLGLLPQRTASLHQLPHRFTYVSRRVRSCT